jgi:hypothetical protein
MSWEREELFARAIKGALVVLLMLFVVGCSDAAVIKFAQEDAASSVVISNPEKKKGSKVPVAGDVILAGGASGTKSSPKAEFYTPSTKKWTATGSLTTDRMVGCGVILADGTFIDAGGASVSSKTKNELVLTITPHSSADEYNLSNGTFSSAGSMTTPRAGCTATLLNDGTVLIAGGLDSSGNPLNTAEVYDPTGGSFTATTGNMNSPRAFHTATLLTTGPLAGDVLVAGGLANDMSGSSSLGDTLDTADIYDPSSKTFTPTLNTMTDFRAFHTATLLSDGTVLLTGGDNQGNGGPVFFASQTAELFDPATDEFSAVGQLGEPLIMHSATLLPDGTVLIAGGFDMEQALFSDSGALTAFFGTTAQGAEIYTPSSKTFACIGGTITVKSTQQTVCATKMKSAHAGHAAVLLDDGTVLIAGGFGGSKDTSEIKGTNKVAEIYDPTHQTFTKVGSMPTGLALATAVSVQ